MRFSLALPALAVAVLCLPALPAQRTPPPISFTGVPAYSQAELLSFTGLRPSIRAPEYSRSYSTGNLAL